jgi:predicted transcriptional regulator
LADIINRRDELALSNYEVASRCDVHRSTIYRFLEGKTTLVDRSTLRDIANALDLRLEIKGSNARVYIEKSTGGSEPITTANDGLRRVLEMLKKMDVEQIDAVDKMSRMIALMDREEVINMTQVFEQLGMIENRAVFIEKLTAFAKIIMPYKVIHQNERTEESQSGVFGQG